MEKLKELLNKKYSRAVIVAIFIILFIIANVISLRGSYLEYKELGENYIQNFFTNLKCKYLIMFISFILIYIIIYFTNRGIKKGIKPFLEQDKIEIPKLPNKSISLIVAAILSVILSNILQEKILMFMSNVSFGIVDPIFNLDISYYMFIKPLIEVLAILFVMIIIGISIYSALYHIIVFNLYCNGVDRELLKNSLLFRKLQRNVILVTLGIVIMIIINMQNIVLEPFMTIKNEEATELIGAGFIESTLKLWGYGLFTIVIFIAAIIGVKYFKKRQARKVVIALLTIPGYLIVFFIVMQVFDFVYINSNELDQENDNITDNINFTKAAYNINIEEINLDYTGTITIDEVNENSNVINNIPLVSKEMVINTLQDTQTETGYYKYNNVSIASYDLEGKKTLMYVAPREITNDNITYDYKTYQYTHGMGEILVSVAEVSDTGKIKYIQKEIDGSDEVININNPRIYFGLETNDTIVTNSKNKSEYDYTDINGVQYEYQYTGKSGLSLGFFDKLALAIKKGDIKLAFSSSIESKSKILINRNVRQRAKTAIPYLMYDENPYTVIDDNGDIYWVVDAYTTSSQYPYSQYINIKYEGQTKKINYIRNSIKVIINAYDGTMKFYITDRTDPIAIAYSRLYPDLFEDKDVAIPEDISNKFVYPKFLYDIQAKMLEIYHNVKPEVLYRNDDIWNFATYNTTQTNKVVGSALGSYYTMANLEGKDELALVQIYTKEGKSNIISYLVGKTEGSQQKLKLYKFSSDSGILGPTQLDKQIELDETISKQLATLNTTGSKITKNIIIVPIENTLLYVEPIYQTMINESNVPVLKKVIVASGTKMAIGDNFSKALENLLSRYAVNIEIDNTENIEGLIQSIIKANNNLTESSQNGNWEMVGNDIQELQKLINSLENALKQDKENSTQELDLETNNKDIEKN